MNEVLAFQATLIVCGTVSLVATLRFVQRFLELRHERQLRAPTPVAGVRRNRCRERPMLATRITAF